MALSNEDRKFIRLGLPHGSQSEIAQKLGISRVAVNRYLFGKSNSDRIEKSVIEKYDQVKKEREDIRRRIYG